MPLYLRLRRGYEAKPFGVSLIHENLIRQAAGSLGKMENARPVVKQGPCPDPSPQPIGVWGCAELMVMITQATKADRPVRQTDFSVNSTQRCRNDPEMLLERQAAAGKLLLNRRMTPKRLETKLKFQ